VNIFSSGFQYLKKLVVSEIAFAQITFFAEFGQKTAAMPCVVCLSY
jgi:hypothetical protein